MKLLYSPGACSLGIHVLLEEIGAPYETQLVSFKDAEQYSPAFMALNPKSKIPVLVRDNGAPLTEFGAIAAYLTLLHPEAAMMPASPDAAGRAVEAMDYITGTIHSQGFTRIARPGNFSDDPASHPAVQAKGRDIFSAGLALIDRGLGSDDWLAGSYSVADMALFYVSRWSTRAERPLPANVSRHFEAMKARPAVRRAMAAEGLPH